MGAFKDSGIYKGRGIYKTGAASGGGGGGSINISDVCLAAYNNTCYSKIDENYNASVLSFGGGYINFRAFTYKYIPVICNEFEIGIRFLYNNGTGVNNYFLSNVYASDTKKRFIWVILTVGANYLYVQMKLRGTGGSFIDATGAPNYAVNLNDGLYHSIRILINEVTGNITAFVDDIPGYLSYNKNSVEFYDGWYMGIGCDSQGLYSEYFSGLIDLKNWYVKNDGVIVWGNEEQ